jgi:hypothetical protein
VWDADFLSGSQRQHRRLRPICLKTAEYDKCDVPTPGFDIVYGNFDASAAVRLRSPLSTLPAGIIAPRFPRRSPKPLGFVAAGSFAPYILRMFNIPRCKRCLDVGWVCERHPDKPWAKHLKNGCECGAGDPCPDCNDLADGEQPRTDSVITSLDATRDKGRLH